MSLFSADKSHKHYFIPRVRPGCSHYHHAKECHSDFDYCRRLGGAFSKVVDRLCARHMGVIMLGIQGVIQRWIGVRPHIMGIPPINNTSLYLDDPTATPHPHPITHPTPQPTPPHPTRSRHVATIWQLGTELWPNGLSQEYPQTCLRRVNIENV